MTHFVLAILECSCYVQNSVIRPKEPVSQICVVPFSNFGNWITFDPLRIRWCLLHLNYIAHYRPHLHCCYYSASHKKYAILLDKAWLKSQKLGFTLFLLYSHKGWSEALVCDSVY